MLYRHVVVFIVWQIILRPFQVPALSAIKICLLVSVDARVLDSCLLIYALAFEV